MMAHTRKIQLADPSEGERDLPIEVLIGGDLLENSKGCFYNTPDFITGLTPYKVRLDFDWKPNGYYC
jgi:hypothetical protein